MPADRVAVVLAAMASVDRDGATVIDRVCVAAVSLMSLSGAGISLMVNGELRGSAGVSEPAISVMQELQLELGEGPGVDAWTGDVAIVEPDLVTPATARWPAFSLAAERVGMAAVFAFPMRLGSIRIGVLVLYRDRAGPLDDEEMAFGLVLADIASQVVLAVQAGAPADTVHDLLADEPAHWAEIHQATGMVSVQLSVPMDEAFVRLRAHAFADSRSLREIARDVVARRLIMERNDERR
jgi:hypothetical protein